MLGSKVVECFNSLVLQSFLEPDASHERDPYMVMNSAAVRIVVAAVVLPVVAMVVLITPEAAAQGGITFDQAVQGAFARNCERMGGSAGNYGAGIGTPSSTLSMCPTAAGTVSGTSGGSITAGTSQGVQDEERRLLQRLKAKRDGENGGAPGASADSEWTLQGLSVFASGEFEALQKRFTKFEPAYNSDSWGGTLGVDYAFARWVVAGIAFNYAHADGDFRRSSGGFDTDSYGPVVYAGFVPARNVFVDVFAATAQGLCHQSRSLRGRSHGQRLCRAEGIRGRGDVRRPVHGGSERRLRLHHPEPDRGSPRRHELPVHHHRRIRRARQTGASLSRWHL